MEVWKNYNDSIGFAIKKFKMSNLSAIFILLAADLGIGYFTLPYVFNIDNIWGKFILGDS